MCLMLPAPALGKRGEEEEKRVKERSRVGFRASRAQCRGPAQGSPHSQHAPLIQFRLHGGLEWKVRGRGRVLVEPAM